MIRRLIILLLIVSIPKLVQAKQKNNSFINSISFYKGSPKGLSGTLGQSSLYDDNISFNINIQAEKNKNLFINYFIEYNKFNHSAIPAKYEMYLVGIGLQKNFDIFSSSEQKTSLTFGYILGYSDDKYTLDAQGMDLYKYGDYDNSNKFTFDDNYFLFSFEYGLFYKYKAVSINIKSKYTFTYESYGSQDIKDIVYDMNSNGQIESFGYDAFLEDNKPIIYKQIQIGLSYYLSK